MQFDPRLTFNGRRFVVDWETTRKDVLKTVELMADALDVQPHQRREFIEHLVERQLSQIGEIMVELYGAEGSMNRPRTVN